MNIFWIKFENEKLVGFLLDFELVYYDIFCVYVKLMCMKECNFFLCNKSSKVFYKENVLFLILFCFDYSCFDYYVFVIVLGLNII